MKKLHRISRSADGKIRNVEFDSSALRAGCYEPASGTLILEFRNGKAYEYDGVPHKLWDKLLEAGSAGKVFAYGIRGVYPSERVA